MGAHDKLTLSFYTGPMNPLRQLFFFLALSLGTAVPLLAAEGGAKNTDADFDKMALDFISGYLSARPLQGVALGYHQYDGKIGDFSRLAIDAEIERLQRFQDEFGKLDASKLSKGADIDRRILQAAIAKELFQLVDMGIFEKNPMTYAGALDVNIYIKRDFKPLEDRVRDIVTIEDQAANIMTAAKTNLAPALPKPYVELAIQIANGSADFLEKDFAEALKDMKDEALISAFRDSNQKAAAALRDFAGWLTKERLPKAIPDFALGAAKYQKMLAATELVDLPPDKLLAIGLQRLKEEQQIFADAARIIDPKKSPIEVFKQIQNEHPKPGELIAEVAKDLDLIRQWVLDHKIVSIPSDVRVTVAETPQFDRATTFASMDTPGPFEKKATQAYYYITPTEDSWSEKQKNEWLTAFNYYTADVVSIHEAYPGHYVQFLHLNASSATQVEKIFDSYAFVEGWAHYTEKMMLDEGFGSVPNPTPEQKIWAAKYRMAQADEALLRLCRLCVSIKMHTQGMSVADGTKFFQDNSYYEAKPAMSEAMRGTYDPGYLNYTLGKLQILKLRDDYKAQEGKNFSLETFHDEMLNHGAPPLRLLREFLLKDSAKWRAVL
ncbi:MAG: DUF885 domain-containing protein [Chthoniobacterales bacterium]|nr:DUF885 domain-containing protein [Chthoniobacterales bacterium]